LNTHWHPDHTSGNLAVKEATGAEIWGPAGEMGRVPGLDHALSEGDRVSIGNHRAEVWEVPGHTLGHIAYVFGDDAMAFVGDTLFAMGCGRLFEGTAEQMDGSLRRLAALPPVTELYCAHEYTLSNARFAARSFPLSKEIADRLRHVEQERLEARPTVPTTVAQERATNPFLLARDVAHFAQLRTEKDNFR
jgi:hydroxyacylglutathione hydrolase